MNDSDLLNMSSSTLVDVLKKDNSLVEKYDTLALSFFGWFLRTTHESKTAPKVLEEVFLNKKGNYLIFVIA